MTAKKILLVEDDPGIAEVEADYLTANGFDVEIAQDGRQGKEKALHGDYDLLLLDIMLPGVDGFSICREVRAAKNTPILMVSAKREEIDKIRALGLGADDYIVKPFSPNELVARVKAHIARYERLTGTRDNADALCFGDLEIRRKERGVRLAGKEIALKNREFELLLFLAENPGVVFSKDKLFDRIWGMDAMGDTATVTVHINRIREKIEPNPGKPRYIETVWGAGYRFRGK
ncbi:MAG: response regulator transcription factor [Schwartzia sp. (in: firmicutes)]